MARVKLSPLLTDISGSIGGMTIQRNKFGISLRQRPLPGNPSTSAQYNIRRRIVEIQAAWQLLTDAQRLQWSRFLDFSGQSIRADRSVKLSGHSLYIKYQLLRLLAGQSLLTTIAYSVMPDIELIEKIEQVGNSLKVYFNAQVDSTKYFFNIKLTSPRKESIRYSPRGIRYMSVAFGSATSYEMVNPYTDAFGALPGLTSIIHVSIQYFSIVAPVFNSPLTYVLAVE